MPPSDPPPCAPLAAELDAGLELGASDWHFKGGEACRVRIEGDLVPLERPSCEEREIEALWRMAAPEGGADASFEHRGNFFRLHSYSAGGALCLSLRRVAGKITGLGALGVPAGFTQSLLRARRGLIVVAGPAGSGKSTTLAAAVDLLNRERAGLILTFEDPVEFRHEGCRSLVRQLERGRDFTHFAEALHGVLRCDPNIVVLGELRDSETISAALAASETGHLVLATLHGASAKDAVSRIVAAFPAERGAEARARLGKNLVAALAQQLVKSTRGRRIAAFELLLATPAVRHLIASPGAGHDPLGNEIATGRAHGMVSMEQSLEDLWRRRAIGRDEALACAIHPASLEPLLAPAEPR